MNNQQIPSGPTLKALRKAAGIRQDDMAALANITASHLSRIEAGERVASERVAEAILQCINGKSLRVCSLEGCTEPHMVRGMCKKHYQSYREAEKARKKERPSSASLFWSKVEKTDSCWNWTAGKDQAGYGLFTYEGRLWKAHRVAWELYGRGFVNGSFLDHICHNRECVNPEHLREATPKQNAENRRVESENTPSGIRGVYRQGPSYVGRVSHDGQLYRTRPFRNKEEAAEALIALRNELFTHNDADRRGAA